MWPLHWTREAVRGESEEGDAYWENDIMYVVSKVMVVRLCKLSYYQCRSQDAYLECISWGGGGGGGKKSDIEGEMAYITPLVLLIRYQIVWLTRGLNTSDIDDCLLHMFSTYMVACN